MLSRVGILYVNYYYINIYIFPIGNNHIWIKQITSTLSCNSSEFSNNVSE